MFISVGAGKRDTGSLEKKILMPFKNIKDIIKKIMTCYSVTTKGNKRNWIEEQQGKTGVNWRKDFLTAKVIKHWKWKFKVITEVLRRTF